MPLALLIALLLLAGPPERALAQPDAAAEAQRGKAAMTRGDFETAAAVYEQLVKAFPADAGMRLNLGMALSMSHRLGEAMPHLERAAALQPTLAPAWLFLGANWLQMGAAAKAVPALRKVVGIEPGNIRARTLLGDALRAQDQDAAAAEQFAAVTSGDPASARGWFGLGRSYEALARRTFARLERLPDGSTYAALLRADVLAASTNLSGAIELYRQVLERSPALRPAREELAMALERAGDDAGAAEERKRLRPESCESRRSTTAACEFRAGRHAAVVRLLEGSRSAPSSYWLARAYNELARDAFNHLAALPPSPELHQFRAGMLRDRGKHLEAAEELRLASEMVPGDPALQQERARALLDAKSFDEAIRILEPLAARAPSPDTLFLLGDALLISGRPAEALPKLKAALAAVPGFLPAHASLGRAYLETGDARSAIAHLEAALKVDGDGSVHYQLARAYQATGRAAMAKRMLEKYAAIEKARRNH
jgi:tetratricopeptide (TPR) repeat protein